MTDPMKIMSISCRNYRGFDSIQITFHERLTVIIAPNGGGKTAVLDAIAASLSMLVDGLMRKKGSKGFDRNEIHRLPDSHGFMQSQFPVSIQGETKLPLMASPAEWRRELGSLSGGRTTTAETRLIREWAKIIGESLSFKKSVTVALPIIAYYGTGRLWGELRLTNKRKTQDATPNARERGYQDCLEPSSHYRIFLDWFRRFAYQSKQERESLPDQSPQHNAQRFIDVVARAVDGALEPTGWGSLAWDFAEDTITAKHPQFGRLPVDMLSDGIRMVIGLVADIAHRAARLNPHLGSEAHTAPGIVLVDEVDMHLHPAWQQHILASLLTAFPCVQFIVTTHSPLGHPSIDALTQVMEVSAKPPIPLVDIARAYEALVKSGVQESPEAVHLKQQLDAGGYEIPEADLALWHFLAKQGQRP